MRDALVFERFLFTHETLTPTTHPDHTIILLSTLRGASFSPRNPLSSLPRTLRAVLWISLHKSAL